MKIDAYKLDIEKFRDIDKKKQEAEELLDSLYNDIDEFVKNIISDIEELEIFFKKLGFIDDDLEDVASFVDSASINLQDALIIIDNR